MNFVFKRMHFVGYDQEEWEAEYTSSSDEEIPMTDADRVVPGARVVLVSKHDEFGIENEEICI